MDQLQSAADRPGSHLVRRARDERRPARCRGVLQRRRRARPAGTGRGAGQPARLGARHRADVPRQPGREQQRAGRDARATSSSRCRSSAPSANAGGSRNTLRSKALLLTLDGELDAAEQAYDEALDLMAQLKSRDDEAFLLVRIAELALRRGDAERAREVMQRAYDTAELSGGGIEAVFVAQHAGRPGTSLRRPGPGPRHARRRHAPHRGTAAVPPGAVPRSRHRVRAGRPLRRRRRRSPGGAAVRHRRLHLGAGDAGQPDPRRGRRRPGRDRAGRGARRRRRRDARGLGPAARWGRPHRCRRRRW